MVHEVMPSIVHPLPTIAQIARAMTPVKSREGHGEMNLRERPRAPNPQREGREKNVRPDLLSSKRIMTSYQAMREVEKKVEAYQGTKRFMREEPMQIVYRFDDGPKPLTRGGNARPLSPHWSGGGDRM